MLDGFRTARQLTRGQELTRDPFEPVQVGGDEDRFKQLSLILLENVLKYTPPNVCVTLGLRRGKATAEILVRDTEGGISAADLPRVFERLYRSDSARGRDPSGTGLGLSIVRWIAEQHGGTLSLESLLGPGTTVIVRLPEHA